jgi:hypothetical protein
MVFVYKISLSHIVIFSISWIVLTLIIFNYKIIKKFIFKTQNEKTEKGDIIERIIQTNRFTVNVVYDTDIELNIDDICDLTISYEKLIKGGYKLVESSGSIDDIKKTEYNKPQVLIEENTNPDNKPQDNKNDGLNNYVKIKTIKN